MSTPKEPQEQAEETITDDDMPDMDVSGPGRREREGWDDQTGVRRAGAPEIRAKQARRLVNTRRKGVTLSTPKDKPQKQVEETIADLDVTDEEAAEQVRGGNKVQTPAARVPKFSSEPVAGGGRPAE